MAFVEGNFVRIPDVSTNTPSNPLLGYNKSRTATPSTSESGAVSQSTLTHQILLYDQRCLVTGAVSNQIQACHLINTIRMDKTNEADKLAVKADVERILTRQRFGVGDFYLDSLPNCIALESQLRGDLDTYGSFCIMPQPGQLWQIVEELEKTNNDWDKRAASDPGAVRDLDVRKAPFVFKRCTILVLRPDLFLPDNRPLLVNRNRALRTPGGTPPDLSQASSWVPHHLTFSSPYLSDSGGTLLEEFEFKSLRHEANLPSILSLIVNANSKFQQFHKDPPSVFLTLCKSLLSGAVELIFHVPNGLLGGSPPPTPPPADLSSHSLTPRPQFGGDSSTQFVTNPSPEPGRDVDIPQGQHPMDLEHQEVDATNESSNPETYFEEFGGDSEGDGPDTVNGLTFPEMKIVLNRVSDGSISDRERAEAAMLMLGMAGGHRRPHALSPLIRDHA